MTTVKILQPLSVLLLLVELLKGVQDARIFFPGENTPSRNEIVPRPASRNVCYVDGKKGECLYLKKCPELLNFIKARHGLRTNGTTDYLKNRICKREVKNVKLCCLATKTSMTRICAKFVSNPLPSNTTLSPYVPSLDECGISTVPKIWNGDKFKHGSHPWLVGIGYPDANVSLRVHCGGSLITKKHVLSAAHCFLRKPTPEMPEFTHVILGEHNLAKDIEKQKPVVRRILKVKHPGCSPETLSHDISLLVLEKEVTFTIYIRPVCLPFFLRPEDIDFSKGNALIVGWGIKNGNYEETEVPLETEVNLVPKNICETNYGFSENEFLDDSKICFLGNNSDACEGDSGGPLIYLDLKKHSRYFILGVINFGSECGSSFYPGVYSYVPHYLSWINQNL